MLVRAVLATGALVSIAIAFGGGCGSSGDQDSPPLPRIDVEVASQLVDVGQRYEIDAGESQPGDGGSEDLEFFWTVTPPANSHTEFDDHCADDPTQICTDNLDACADDPSKICTTNADCDTTIPCLEDFGETSPQCTTGACDVDEGRTLPAVTLLADVPGPYAARVTVESNDSNDTASVDLDTYPSLHVLGSLFALGGTEGALVAEFADAETFSADAVDVAASPVTGNLLLAIPTAPGRIREIDYHDGNDLGRFGETSDFVTSPVALAFDDEANLFVANADGVVQLFDAAEGRFARTVGDVATGLEQVIAIAISPVNGELLVVDGRAGEAVRRYNVATGNFVGPLGTIEAVASQAVDIAFFGSPATNLFVADAGGALVRCATNGTGCASVAAAAGLLSAGGPTSVATNPSADFTEADVLVADAIGLTVIACDAAGTSCEPFGESEGLDSEYLDLVFAPTVVPEVDPPPMITTTTTSSTTTTVAAE